MQLDFSMIPRGVPPEGKDIESCQVYVMNGQCTDPPVAEVVIGCEGERIRRNLVCHVHLKQYEQGTGFFRCLPCGRVHGVQLLAVRQLAAPEPEGEMSES